MNRGIMAFACLAVASGLLFAGGSAREAVAQNALLSDTSLPAWEFNAFDPETGSGCLLVGQVYVHKLLVSGHAATPSAWTFYDADKAGDTSRKICSVVALRGDCVEIVLDVRVRKGLFCQTAALSGTATVLYQAD